MLIRLNDTYISKGVNTVIFILLCLSPLEKKHKKIMAILNIFKLLEPRYSKTDNFIIRSKSRGPIVHLFLSNKLDACYFAPSVVHCRQFWTSPKVGKKVHLANPFWLSRSVSSSDLKTESSAPTWAVCQPHLDYRSRVPHGFNSREVKPKRNLAPNWWNRQPPRVSEYLN